MKKLFLTLSLLLTLGLSTSGVSAQVAAPTLDDEMLGFEEVEGLVSVYDRTFSMDMEAMLASPDADFASMDMSALMRSVSITAYTFESDDDAERFMDEMRDEANAGLEEMTETLEDGQEITITDIEVVDKDGMTMTMVMDMDDLSIAMTMHVFVDGNHVFLVSATDSELEASAQAADGLAQYVVDTEAGSDDVTFSEDGTSTGGVYDRMPQVGDELVGDFVATDYELYVAE